MLAHSRNEDLEDTSNVERWMLDALRVARKNRMHGKIAFQFKGGKCIKRSVDEESLPPKEQ